MGGLTVGAWPGILGAQQGKEGTGTLTSCTLGSFQN
uniref:Motor neuron and pancreas homeobox 1 n=3 Tax=Homininae TaxID=207598 RepID=A0A2I3S8R2_PANTR